MGERRRLARIGSSDGTVNPWNDAIRWLLVAPVALLPLLIALMALALVKVVLAAIGVSMVAFAYLLAGGASAYLSVKWSAGIAPQRGWGIGRTLAIAYVLTSVAGLVAVTVLDHHPPQALPENETPDLIQMLGFAGLGVGALAGYIWMTGARKAHSIDVGDVGARTRA